MAVSGGKKSLRLWKRVRKLHLSATQIIPLVFAAIILYLIQKTNARLAAEKAQKARH